MVLRPMHMAERKVHHFSQDFYGVLRCFGKAYSENTVNAPCMAFIADIVPLYAAGSAENFFMANHAFHLDGLAQVLQGCFTDQTFLIHALYFLHPKALIP